MIPLRNELPEDAADWVSVNIDLQRLCPDSNETCPLSFEQLFGFIKIESSDTDSASRNRFSFIRTAMINSKKYWLWTYTESDGSECFVLVQQDEKGSLMTSLTNSNGLSAEQYILADYFDEVYWS
ncbi:MAG: hypothetical protein Q8L68_02095 [Methylococcales bacterium]|nr:hypothetical protein [Methylococcales bacterium]